MAESRTDGRSTCPVCRNDYFDDPLHPGWPVAHVCGSPDWPMPEPACPNCVSLKAQLAEAQSQLEKQLTCTGMVWRPQPEVERLLTDLRERAIKLAFAWCDQSPGVMGIPCRRCHPCAVAEGLRTLSLFPPGKEPKE